MRQIGTTNKVIRRRPRAGRWALFLAGIGVVLVAPGVAKVNSAIAAPEPVEQVATAAAGVLALARDVANAKNDILGSLMFYDPVQDLAGGVDGVPYGAGDRAWVEAALGVYDLYRQIGGEAARQRYLFRREPDRVFVGAEGGAGHWHSSIEMGQAAFLGLLARSSRTLPASLRTAVLGQVDPLFGPLVDELVSVLSKPDGVLLVPLGATRTLRFPEAWQAVGTAGLDVSARPAGEDAIVASVTRTPDEAAGAKAVIVFRDGYRFTPKETIEVAAGTAPGGVEAAQPANTASPPEGPDHLDPKSAAPVTDGITTSGQTRHFRISIPAVGGYVIQSTGPSDVTGQLKGPDGVVVARDDDGGLGYNFALQATLQPGDYTLEVAHCCAGTGSYSLTITTK
jgi:hypothetical protein